MDLLREPHFQLAIYLPILFLATIVSKLNSAIVLMYGINTLLIWILIASLAGISTDYSWWYYIYLSGSLLTGYLCFWGCWLITEKFGNTDAGEGSLYAIAPLTVGPVLLILSLLSKLVWHFFTVG